MAQETDSSNRIPPPCNDGSSNSVSSSPKSPSFHDGNHSQAYGKRDEVLSGKTPPLTLSRDTAILSESEHSRTLTFANHESTVFKAFPNQAVNTDGRAEKLIIDCVRKELSTHTTKVHTSLWQLVNIPGVNVDILKCVLSELCDGGKGEGGEEGSTSERNHTETTSLGDHQAVECTGSGVADNVVTGLGRGSGDLKVRHKELPNSDVQRDAAMGDLLTATMANSPRPPDFNSFNHNCEKLPPCNREKVNEMNQCEQLSELSLQTKPTEETSALSPPKSPIMETQSGGAHPFLMPKPAWCPHMQDPTVAAGASSVPRPQGPEVNMTVTPVSTKSDSPLSAPLQTSGSADAVAEPHPKKWIDWFLGKKHKKSSPEVQSNPTNKKTSPELLPYPMNKEEHGLALLIVNDEFKRNPDHPNTKKLAQREGAEEDIEQLQKIWTYLKYRVRVEKNLTMEQIERLFEEIQEDGDPAKTIQEGDDSFVCCLSSHGTWDSVSGMDVVYGVDGVRRKDGQIVKGALNIRVLAYEKFSPLKGGCPKLKGRPKMFFIQACRGGRKDRTISIYDPETVLPPETDFLFVYSTSPGRQSYRNDTYGSIFIVDLSKSLKKHAHSHDLISILQSVIQKETEQDDPCELQVDGDTVITRQCPNFSSSLRRPVFFFQ